MKLAVAIVVAYIVVIATVCWQVHDRHTVYPPRCLVDCPAVAS